MQPSIRLALAFIVAISSVACGDDSRPTDTGTTSDTGPTSDSAIDSATGDASCGPSPCGACESGCTNADRCGAAGWECNCICGDASAPDASSDASPPGDASSCTSVQGDAAAFIAANKACTVADDCVQAPAACYGAEEACCTVYLTAGYDETAWMAHLTAMESCAGSACACCRALAPPPACNGGMCGPEGG